MIPSASRKKLRGGVDTETRNSYLALSDYPYLLRRIADSACRTNYANPDRCHLAGRHSSQPRLRYSWSGLDGRLRSNFGIGPSPVRAPHEIARSIASSTELAVFKSMIEN